jgi:hypothetical protein
MRYIMELHMEPFESLITYWHILVTLGILRNPDNSIELRAIAKWTEEQGFSHGQMARRTYISMFRNQLDNDNNSTFTWSSPSGVLDCTLTRPEGLGRGGAVVTPLRSRG